MAPKRKGLGKQNIKHVKGCLNETPEGLGKKI